MTSIDVGDLRARKVRLAEAVKEKKLRKERRLQSDLGEQGRQGGLIHFVRYFWHILEPATPFVEGWVVNAVAMHLEAVTRGEIKRLLINVPPGTMKSLLVNCFWPAWEWSAGGMPSTRYVTFSYAAHLTIRDNAKFRDVIQSHVFRELWGHVVTLKKEGEIKPENDKTGWKFASSVGGVGTGERANRVLADDLHSVKSAESETVRTETVRWTREGMSNRLNDMAKDVIIGIGQRVHEEDASAAMLKDGDYVHLNIPMEYDSTRHCVTEIGWEDPRTEDGELAWPERFPKSVVAKLKQTLGPYAYSAQYQQAPTPRGGGLIKDHWWQVHEVVKKEAGGYRFVPDIEPLFVLASLDTAFSEKETNDYSAMTVWVVYDDPVTKHRRILLADGWKKRLSELHGETVEKKPGETEGAYRRRAQQKWGLVEWVNHTCRVRRVNRLIVENKTRAHDVVKELRRVFADLDWGIVPVNPKGDKTSRGHSVVDLFTDDMIYAPAEVTEEGDVRFLDWADMVIRDTAVFPHGAHDDVYDTVTQALRHLRESGLAVRREERAAEENFRAQHRGGPRQALYPA